ncbi:MAG: icmS [Gammaproteobacteria bacterium]|jgi:intracellular multiplication protein IcmS|nr:icmS [Gammaproteobacteria bacterium]
MDIAKQLIAFSESQGVKYTFNGNMIAEKEVFSVTGLLPGLARRADQLASLCLGYGIGATFTETEKTLLGITVNFDETTPRVLRLMCIMDVLFEIIKLAPSKSAVSLDELMYD